MLSAITRCCVVCLCSVQCASCSYRRTGAEAGTTSNGAALGGGPGIVVRGQAVTGMFTGRWKPSAAPKDMP